VKKTLRSTLSGSALLLALAAGPAFATGNFPAAIKAELGASKDPGCEVCHRGTPARGTVNTAFGSAMRERGLAAFNENSLRTALAQVRSDNLDSDGDGTKDIDELIAGTDPSVSPGGGGNNPQPAFGCGASATGGIALVQLAGLSALVALRRRRRQ
jgi:uncharacterized protein (TIGR03382 family)